MINDLCDIGLERMPSYWHYGKSWFRSYLWRAPRVMGTLLCCRLLLVRQWDQTHNRRWKPSLCQLWPVSTQDKCSKRQSPGKQCRYGWYESITEPNDFWDWWSHTCCSPGTKVRQHWHPSLISFVTKGRHLRATRTGITLASSFDMF